MKEKLDRMQQTLCNIIDEGDYDHDPNCAIDVHDIEKILSALNKNNETREIAEKLLLTAQ